MDGSNWLEFEFDVRRKLSRHAASACDRDDRAEATQHEVDIVDIGDAARLADRAQRGS